jgi:hypothetical protein
MGKVILELTNGFGSKSSASFRCKDSEAAKKIADKRPNCTNHTFYEDGAVIPRPVKKKPVVKTIEGLKELEDLLGIS